ncbi:MAG: DUF5916 domain-containing protein [Gammaproteobacteria bacterium]|nr:DUF5916 domain-containing protein [Gammaproteobacteria bacterium]
MMALSVRAEQDDASGIAVDFGNGEPISLTRFAADEANIEVDGHLVENAWTGLPVFRELRVLEPDTMAVPTYPTEVRILYTEKGLYVGVDMQQPADTLVKRFTPRDDFDVNRDYVSITLDTSGSGRYGYWMNVSLGDSQRDGTILPERQYSRDWDGAWYGATQTTEKGWSAELFIPWSQVAMPRQQNLRRIGFYIQRQVAHRNERWGWPALASSQSRFMSALQPLQLQGIDPRQQWSVFPYASSTYDRVDADIRYKAGLDLFWRPSSNFQLTATANPDFGSVESDDVVVNLTANETFFPEKRLFFQEGQEIFDTTPRADADGDRRFTVVNTRRIGGRPGLPALPPGASLDAREALQVADILGAAKMTGQLGGFRYGFLAAVEDQTDFTASDNNIYSQDGQNFGTLRVIYEDSRGAAYRGLGFASTVVAHPDADAYVHAADAHFLSSNGKWRFDGQLVYSDRDLNGTGSGGIADLTYIPRQGLKHSLELSVFDDKINVNDFGFQTRNNNTDVWYRMEWVRSGLNRIRDFKLTPFLRYEENGEGYRTNNAIASGYEFITNKLHTVNGTFAWFPQRYDDRNSFGNGTFTVAERVNFDVNYTTDTSLPVSLTGKLAYRGEFVGGRTLEAGAGVTWRPRQNINVILNANYQDRDGWLLHQQGQDFTAFNAEQWQPEFSLEVFPTAKQQLRISMQWIGVRAEESEFYTLPTDSTDLVQGPKPPGPTDDFSISQLNFQVRYRWQIAPLSDLFIVYTKADQRFTTLTDFSTLFQDSWSAPLGDQLIIKLRYRLGS